MAKKIDQSQVIKVAKLSRLDLTEDEVQEFTGQLSAKESLGTEKVLANAPQRDNEFFKVPKILDDGSGA